MIYILGFYIIMGLGFCILYLFSLFYASAGFQSWLSRLRKSNELEQRPTDEQKTAH